MIGFIKNVLTEEERQAIFRQPYKERLKHPLWQSRRLDVAKRAGFFCEECGDKSRQVQVHHLYYIRDMLPWEYPNHLLMLLCDDHHKERQAVEEEFFIKIAFILRDKRIDEIKKMPLWTMVEVSE